MLEDRLLIWRLRSGSTEAFRRIYEKYIDDLLTLATNLLGDGSAAEDIVQETFIRLCSVCAAVSSHRKPEELSGDLCRQSRA